MFELHITCSKDISKLKIDFTDGTCVCAESPEKPEKSGEAIKVPKGPKVPRKPEASKTLENIRGEYVAEPETSEPSGDWIIHDKPKTQEAVRPPEIPDLNRPPKIDEVLNNLEI